MTEARIGRLYRCKITDSAGNVVYSDAAEIVLLQETWSYTYNADGMRTKRTNGTTTYEYVYNGGSLSRMTVGSHTLIFGYDATGKPLYVHWNNSRYFYATNLQGDVIAIVSVNGIPVVEYTYDAWGNVLSVTGTRANNLGKLNPLRYRGYVYDVETELYYLQSRYYDPDIGRFLNADALVATGQGMLGNNMFAYCLNNPIAYADSSGTMPKFLPEYMEEFTEWVETVIGTLLYVTEVNKKGFLKEYWVDSNGKVRWSRHRTNHGNSKKHPVVPHDHEWYDDDDGNNTEDPKWQPPNPGFQAPGSNNDNSTKIVGGVAGTVAVGYVIYVGAKWIIAALAAPATSGGSLIVAGVTP